MSLLVAHVVWVDAYQGDYWTVRNVRHRFEMAQHNPNNSGEIWNFSPIAGACYGYAPRFRKDRITGEKVFKEMNISALGATADAESLDGVTVIWTATPAPRKNRVVVGWYNNATAFRIPRRFPNPGKHDRTCYFTAPSNSCFLIPAHLRDHEILRATHPDLPADFGGPGTDALYYPKPRATGELSRYIMSAPGQVVGGAQRQQPADVSEPREHPTARGPRQPDIETRLAVERAAMDEVKNALSGGQWTYTDVAAECRGWDITAHRQGVRSLRVEVKGLSGSLATVELTPNEYGKLKADSSEQDQDRYIVAIVTDALDPQSRMLQCFAVQGDRWLPFDIKTGAHVAGSFVHLVITPVEAARCSIVCLPRD